MKTVYFLGHTLSRLIGHFCFDFEVVHQERIIEDGGAILAVNHQSFLDPPLVGISCKREVYYLARKSLLKWPLLGPIFPQLNVIPVDQKRADMSALKTMVKLVRTGNRILVFPEGHRSSDGNLLPAQPGLGLVIAKTLAPVIPMRIFGSYEAFPRTAKLPNFSKIRMVVGEPMHFTKADLEGDSRTVYQDLSNRVMKQIASLENVSPED